MRLKAFGSKLVGLSYKHVCWTSPGNSDSHACVGLTCHYTGQSVLAIRSVVDTPTNRCAAGTFGVIHSRVELNPSHFWLDAVQIAPSERHIIRGGERRLVEPRVMEVLLFLVQHHGEVVTREQILQSVWPRIEVSDDVLSRSIYQLRKHLGDVTAHPKYIATIPKTGYRLLVPPSYTAPDEPKSEDPPRTTSHTMRWAAAGVLAMALAFFGINLMPGPDELAVSAPIAVGFFPIYPADTALRRSELELLALSLNDLVTARKSDFQSGEVAFRILEPTTDAQDRVRQFKQGNLQYGFYGWLENSTGSGRALLTLEVLSRSGSGEVAPTPVNMHELPYLDANTNVVRLRQFRDAIMDRLISAVTNDVPFANSLEPGQLEGFRLLLYGERELYMGTDCGVTAATMLNRSLELIADLPRTYNALGQAYWTQAWECGRSSSLVAEAIQALEYAIDLDPDYLEAVHMYTALLAEHGKLAEAYTYLADYLAKYPDDHYLLFSEIIIFQYAGLLTKSTALIDRILTEDPLALVSEMVDMPYALFYAEEYERFLELSPAIKMASMSFHRAYALWQLGRTDEALALLAATRDASTSGVYVDYIRVLRDLIENNQEGARTKLSSAIDRRQAANPAITDIAFRDGLLLAQSGAPDQALQRLQLAADQGFICLVCFTENSGLANLRTLPEFEKIVLSVERKHLAFVAEFDGMIHR